MAILVSDSSNSKYGTGVATVAVNSGGSGYSVNDVLTLTGGDGNATCTVLTVDGSGVVLTISRTTVGSGYSAGTENTTVAPAGGSGCTIDITVQAGIGTANGFYRAEAQNVSCAGASKSFTTATPATIDVTFANAGNCQGVILTTYTLPDVSGYRDYIVKLQEQTAPSVWTDRASVTVSQSTVAVTNAGQSYRFIIYPFVFTTPYAVDTTPNKWRFSIGLTGTGNDIGYVMTSNGTAISYITWCDTTVSYSANDALIVKDPVVVDQSCTFSGVNGTDATNSYAIILCRGADNTYSGMVNFSWENPPQASYTLTIKGRMIMSSYSTWQIGSEDSPIPAAQQAYVYWDTPPTGTIITNTGLHYIYLSYSGGNMSGNLIWYGEYPTYMQTTLAADANIGDTTLTTTDTTGWSIGDTIAIGKRNASTGNITRTITNISGTTITINSAIASAKHFSGGHILNLTSSKYGIYENVNTTTGAQFKYVLGPHHFYNEGVFFRAMYYAAGGYEFNADPFSMRTGFTIKHCCVVAAASATIGTAFLTTVTIDPVTMDISDNIFYRTTAVSGFGIQYSSFPSLGIYTTLRAVTIKRNIILYSYPNLLSGGPSTHTYDIQDNYFENGDYYYSFMASLIGTNITFKNNHFWYAYGGAISTSYGTLAISTCILPKDISNNYIDACPVAIVIQAATTKKVILNEFHFGDEVANTTDVAGGSGAMMDIIFKSPTVALNIYNANFIYSTPSSRLAVVRDNDTDNADYSLTTYGNIYRTGTGLSDTTARTAGGYAARFESLSLANPLEWEFIIPTGNIQDKTMMVGVWCKINSATYYAGTHQLPRLTIDYDDGTTAYVQASETTDWQFLPLPFVPTTTFGQITVKISTMTDATSTNAYVYFDDFKTLFPAEAPLDTQTMDLWADGLPVVPPIATVLSANDVWSAADNVDYGSNTMGNKLKKQPFLLDDGTYIIKK